MPVGFIFVISVTSVLAYHYGTFLKMVNAIYDW